MSEGINLAYKRDILKFILCLNTKEQITEELAENSLNSIYNLNDKLCSK